MELYYNPGLIDYLFELGKLWSNCTDFLVSTVELQWHEHLWDHENMFEIEVVQANKC